LSTKNKDILFFDKEGYPYNLTYDTDTNQWGGKIYFDENSSDTFRTLCLYIFEKVDSFDFSDIFDLRTSQLFNYSGMTFVPSTFTNESITDIRKVNNSPLFYSKWIYGEDFDKKFPVNSVIAFNNLTGSTSYDNPDIMEFSLSGVTSSTYYNVLGSKKGAILITTYTNNKDFDFIFSGGTISSVDIIKAPDYGNQKLVDYSNLNYYAGKKLSVSGTINNDGVYTYNDYNILKTKVYDFLLPTNFSTGLTIDMSFLLMTQRPELYEGPVNITYNDLTTQGTIIEFTNYINTNIDFTSTGQTIIFENPDGSPIHDSNPEFQITGFVDRDVVITAPLNFIKREGTWIIQTPSAITYTGLSYNDYIELTVVSGQTGQTYHDKRQFQVLNITENEIQVREYVILETGFTYTINKVINQKKIKKLYASQSGVPTPDSFSGYTVCYSTSNLINMTQTTIPSGSTVYPYENTISAMRNRYSTMLNRYGLNLYHYNMEGNNYLIFDGADYNYQPYYSGATASINNIPLTISNNFTYLTTGSTIQDSDVFYFKVDEKFPSYEKVYHYDTAKLAKNNLVEIYFDIQKDSSNFGFNLSLNNVDYFISLSGSSISGITTYSQDTINLFIQTYEDILHNKGFTVYSGTTNDTYTGSTLIVESQYPNINILDVEVRVNHYSKYAILEKISDNSIVIDSSELYLVDTNKSLYDYELATGMIINITGSTHNINNKQYNILRLTPNIIQLSYQGPFLYEYDTKLSISVDSFLRAPRGTYGLDTDTSGRDLYYKLSWDLIEGNDPQVSPDIFYYDYSGSQLVDNDELTYIGSKPLWNSLTNNLVFLNNEPNTNIDSISNPEYQQTVFDTLLYKMENKNSPLNFNYVPVPLQVFIGFNSKNEGVVQNNLRLEKIENVLFSGTTRDVAITGNTSTLYKNNFTISTGESCSYIDYITDEPFFNFMSKGFEPDQHITLQFTENTLTGNTLISNYETYTIIDVTSGFNSTTTESVSRIIVEEILEPVQTSGKTFDFIIKTEPDLVASISIFGQTEIEDERFVQHLKLLGARLDSDVQPIFKESDINEAGIDYTILNRKRKELLSMYPEIYNYIGSYKALINAINFFGYNDLQLYEYYRNIKASSPLYGQLQRVLIEDIFVNTIPGWEEPELDSVNYLKTNLFNLTYRITDFEGNNIDMYSLDEVQQKLTKMVHWLRHNIIPLSSNILDITGVADTSNTLYINYNAANYVKKITVNQVANAINFDYIQTLNIDTNYLFTINFYLTSGATSQEDYSGTTFWTAKIKTFHLNAETLELEPVQYINLYKKDLLSYSFNVDRINEPYMYIETQSYNDYGLGYTNSKMFNYNEGRNFVLINNNFQSINYKYVTDSYGYYIIDDGRFYIIKF
jgi:hypothetical protein